MKGQRNINRTAKIGWESVSADDDKKKIPVNVGCGIVGAHAIIVCLIGAKLSGDVVGNQEGVEKREYTLEVGEGDQVIHNHLRFNDQEKNSYGVYSDLRSSQVIKYKMYAHLMRVEISPYDLKAAIWKANKKFLSASSARYAVGLDDCATFARICLLAIAKKAKHARPVYVPHVMGGVVGQAEQESRRNRLGGLILHAAAETKVAMTQRE